MILTTILALAAAPIDLSDPANVMAAVQKAGFRAELSEDDTGDPMVKSSANGATFVVLFYGCEENKNCTDLQFYAGYELEEGDTADPSITNAFNQEFRFTRAYVDAEGDAVIEMDVIGSDGKIDDGQFARAIDVWSDLMGTFQSRIGY